VQVFPVGDAVAVVVVASVERVGVEPVDFVAVGHEVAVAVTRRGVGAQCILVFIQQGVTVRVQVPQINQKSDAEKVVHAAKYAPLGERGVSVFTRAGNYYKDEAAGHPERQNDETMTVVHIEGQKGLNNLEEIMTVDGIDVLFLGPYDISQSLGVPGDVRSKIVEDALKEAASKARAQGRVIGSYAKDVEMGKWLIDLGVQYLSINVDATIYMQACEDIANALK
ncbi:MAG: HpcH/HpaI aldolase family protein, partial [Dehalococcoidia bacterium]